MKLLHVNCELLRAHLQLARAVVVEWKRQGQRVQAENSLWVVRAV